MDFRVITADSSDGYTGGAELKLLEGGALQVTPQDGRPEKQVIYGPASWVRVEILSEQHFYAR